MEKNPQNDLVYPGERVDDLQNGLYVIQNPEKFCFGMDAVLLSGFADIRQNEKVLDMGTGTGIIPFLLKAKDKGSHLTGLEIQEECADMARRSVSYNHLEADIDIVCGDIKEAAEIFGAASFHAVTSNPPYMIGQHGLQNPYMAKAIARHEILCTLEDVVSQAAAVLKDRGRFYMVHRPFRLAEIFQVLMKYKLEPKSIKESNNLRERGFPDEWKIISLCNPNRKSGRYYTSSTPHIEGSGSDRGRRYPKQY